MQEQVMKATLLGLMILGFYSSAIAELNLSWEQFFGGSNNDQANHLLLTADGGFLAAGYTESYGFGEWGKPDFWMVKFHSDGQIDWEMTYGQPDSLDRAYFMLETTDGYLVAGERMEDIVYGHGAGGIILKMDFSGAVIWDYKYGGDEGDMLRHIQPTDDGFIACGTTRSFGAGFIDGWVMKIDSNGVVDWQNNFGGDSYEVFKQVYPTADGGYLAAGFTNSYGEGSYDIWVVKLDAAGELEWEETIGDANSNRMHCFCPTLDGNYILTGETENDDYIMELFVMKISPTAAVIWEETYPCNGEGEGQYIEETVDGGYIIGGNDTNGIGGPWQSDGWILKISADGTFEEDYFVHSQANEGFKVVRQTADAGYIAAGWNMSYGEGMCDLWLLRLNESIEEISVDVADPFSSLLLSSYPNPFNPSTRIEFTLPEAGVAELAVFNLSGQLVEIIHVSYLSTGTHSSSWQPEADLPAGIYFLRLKTVDLLEVRKIGYVK
jgi:hypothetical protein